MRIVTDHSEGFSAKMDCETCMLTSTVSTFSPVFSQTVMIFAAAHALCETEGRPDFEAMVEDIIDLREKHPTHVAFVENTLAEAESAAIRKRRMAQSR